MSDKAVFVRGALFCVQHYPGNLTLYHYNSASCWPGINLPSKTPSKLFANHNALGQLTNHNTFRFSEGGPSSNPELIEPFVWGWGERYCNNVNYVKNNAIFEPPSMRACSSTPPKQNQDFVKEHNKKKGERGSGVWPSMVTHTRNLFSAFNPSKCTLTAVNTHLEQWAAILRRPGSSWGIGALLKGLTSVVVLKVERALVIHSPHRQSLPDLGIEPATFGLQVQLSNH